MTAQLDQHSAAVVYLSRDAAANRELLLALLYDPLSTVQVATREGAVVGALVRGAGPTGAHGVWLRLDADDPEAVGQLVAEDTLRAAPIVSVHRTWIAELLQTTYGLTPTGDGVYGYTVGRQQLRQQEDAGVRLLTPNDARLVELSGCGWSRAYFSHLFDERRRPWAIVRDGRIVSRASTGYPAAGSEEVIGVWTHPAWRGRGLGRALVGAVADDILGRAPLAAYTTTFSNAASQAVARAVGFAPSFAAVSLQHGKSDYRTAAG